MSKFLMQVSLTQDGAKGLAKDGVPSENKERNNSSNRSVVN
jgi:hypothetical protein